MFTGSPLGRFSFRIRIVLLTFSGEWSYLSADCVVAVESPLYSIRNLSTFFGFRWPRNGIDPTPIMAWILTLVLFSTTPRFDSASFDSITADKRPKLRARADRA